MAEEQPEKQPIPPTRESAGESLPAPMPILQVFQRLKKGRFLDQLQQELQEVVKDVATSETGKAGKVTITFKIERLVRPHLTGNQVLVIVEPIKTVLPGEPPQGYAFFHDQEGGLHARDPFQHDALASSDKNWRDLT